MTEDLFVGRTADLDLLRQRWALARSGQATLALIVGDAGIGKTRLAMEIARLAEAEGGTIAWSRSHEGAGAPPYWAWRQLLPGDVLPVAHLDGFDDRFAYFEAVATEVVALGERAGAVVVFDDIHWADEPSTVLLREVLNQIRRARMLLVATARPTAGAGRGLLAELDRDPMTVRIDLDGFDRAETVACVAAISGEAPSEATAERLRALTGGNPFYLREVARAGNALGPPSSVLEAVNTRIGRLRPETRALLGVAAVVGDEFLVPVVASLLDRPATACFDLLDEARSAGFVSASATPGSFRFAHALVRMAIEETLPTARKVELHRAAALAMEDIYHEDIEPHLAELARHWSAVAATGERRPGYLWARRAAEAAMTAMAYEESARLNRLALDVGGAELSPADRCDALVGLAAAAASSLDWDAASTAAEQAMAAARLMADDGRDHGRAAALARAALALEAVGDRRWDRAIRDRCEEALAAQPEGAAGSRARLLARLTEAAIYEGDDDRAPATSRQALDLAEMADDAEALVSALRARQLACAGPDHVAERAELARRMTDLGARRGRAIDEMWGRLWALDVHLQRGRFAEFAAELARLRACTDRVGGVSVRWHVLLAESALAQGTARFEDALATSRQAFELMSAKRHPAAFGAHMSVIGSVRHHVGFDAVNVPFDTTRPPPGMEPAPGEVRGEIFAFLGPALELADAGRLDEARTLIVRAGPPEEWDPPPYFFVSIFALGARVFGLLGEREPLNVCCLRLEPYRGQFVTTGAGAASSFGPVELALGRSERMLGRLDEAVIDLETAVTACRMGGAVGFAVEAQCELAAALLARGDTDRAVEIATTAQHTAAELGMRPWTAHAAATIAAASEAGVPSAPSPLTRREAEVAALVAAGRTNREIADALFMSERTAQNHVQHILVKLGFSNRAQIAAWMATRRNE